MTATATPEFRQLFAIDRDDDQNRAMVVYRAMENDEVWSMRLVMDVTTGTRWVTSNPAGVNEVVIHELTFDEKVDELFDSAIFAISNDADDRVMMKHSSGDAFNDFLNAMCTVEGSLTSYGFKWYHCSTEEEARDVMAMRGAMVIEATECGVHIFRG